MWTVNQRIVKVLLGGKEHNVLTRVDRQHGGARQCQWQRSGGIILACDGQAMRMTMRTGRCCLADLSKYSFSLLYRDESSRRSMVGVAFEEAF